MNVSDDGIDLIKQFEGCRLKAYLCPAGVWTIGYGHTGGVNKGDVITEDDADDLLRADLVRFERSVLRLVRVPLSQGQFDALVSFAFNLGGGALQRSTLRQKLNRGDYEGAAEQFMKWTRAGGRVLAGLVRRRQAEYELFVS